MIRYLIIEDEEPAAKRLQKLVQEIEPDARMLESIVSIKSAVQWLQQNEAPDLAFMDIHIADGSSFEIFKQTEVNFPVIFTTAYDQYALNAFKVNSVDYLLKPIRKEELQQALEKYKKYNRKEQTPIDLKKLVEALQQPKQEYKQRFIIRYGDHIKTVEISDIAYFYTENRINFLLTNDGKRYPIDFNLDQLEEMLDPKKFFRINRQFIIGIHAITEMLTYSKARVLIKLNPPTKLETIVSTERSADFKHWLGDES